MARIVGIDLGTTNSCISVMEGPEPVVIPNKEGSKTTPSIVAFTQKGERLVGNLAKRQVLINPQNTVQAAKRLIGRKFDSPEVQKAKDILPYKLGPSTNGDVRILVEGKEYSPAEISAIVLKAVRGAAAEYLNDEVSQAIVTVPAYFDDAQRQATKDAGRIAGLDVQRIINEPTAAALAYGFQEKQVDARIAVYDLGGGTFDVSILHLTEGVFEVIATSGDTFLGGEDIDLRLVDWMLERFQAESGIDLKGDPLAMQRLKDAAERAKCELTVHPEADINLPFIATDASGAKHFKTTLTRPQFEEKVRDIIERTKIPCEEALKQAGLNPEGIDEVILVGGQTRTPLVWQTVREIFKREPNKHINPEEVVAIGAALQGGILAGDVGDLVLLDVTPLSLGIETKGEMFTKLIERNSTIPTRRTEIFTTVVDNQSKVTVHVLQGERKLAGNNRSLGKFDLVGIPPAPRGVPQIEVSFDIDSNGIVHVSATDLATKKQQAIRVSPSGGLSEEEIQQIIADAKDHEEEDLKREQSHRLRIRLEGLLDSNQRAFNEFGKMLGDEDREEVQKVLNEASRALDSASSVRVTEALKELQRISKILTEVMLYDPRAYQASAPDGGQAGDSESSGG